MSHNPSASLTAPFSQQYMSQPVSAGQFISLLASIQAQINHHQNTLSGMNQNMKVLRLEIAEKSGSSDDLVIRVEELAANQIATDASQEALASFVMNMIHERSEDSSDAQIENLTGKVEELSRMVQAMQRTITAQADTVARLSKNTYQNHTRLRDKVSSINSDVRELKSSTEKALIALKSSTEKSISKALAGISVIEAFVRGAAELKAPTLPSFKMKSDGKK